MTAAVLDPSVDAVLVGAGEPPGPDERRGDRGRRRARRRRRDRRPELTVLLAGAMSEQLPRFETTDGDRQGEVLLAPRRDGRRPAGIGRSASCSTTSGRRATTRAGRSPAGRPRSPTRSTGAIEVVDIGYNGGLRAIAAPGAGGSPGEVTAAARRRRLPRAAGPGRRGGRSASIGWSTMPIDRHRLRDRLRELRYAPWADASGEGARLRLAAARAALATLVEATPEMSAGPAPDLVVASGGAWAVAPGPAIALAIADVVRRPGAVAIAYDHARLLGPVGLDPRRERAPPAPDRPRRRPARRRSASVVIPAGLRAGRSAGRVDRPRRGGHEPSSTSSRAASSSSTSRPASAATAEFQFRDTVRLGGRGRTFARRGRGRPRRAALDLRDVPLRLPDRPERRRELLEAWQDSLGCPRR